MMTIIQSLLGQSLNFLMEEILLKVSKCELNLRQVSEKQVIVWRKNRLDKY
jgi:hypothetical protein